MILSITIPDDKKDLVINAYCDLNGYSSQIYDENDQPIPNPETKAAFSKRMVIEQIKTVVILYEKKIAEANVVNTTIDIT